MLSVWKCLSCLVGLTRMETIMNEEVCRRAGIERCVEELE